MEFNFPHQVIYKIDGPVSVEEVIATLRANQAVTRQMGAILEVLIPGLQIQSIDLRVDEVALSSLKELFTIALVALYQQFLEERVPALVSRVSGAEIPAEYNKIVTITFLLLLYYGVDFLQKVAIEKLDATALGEKIDVLISELARTSGRTESQIRRALDKKFTRKSVIRDVAHAAKDFFSPSRSRNDEPILVDELTIEPEIIKAVPRQVDEDAFDDEVPPKHLTGVSVQIRATDSDKDAQGWAGIIRTVSDKRMVMRLFPGIDKELLRKQETVHADVVVHYKDRNGELKPSSVDLIRIVDNPAT